MDLRVLEANVALTHFLAIFTIDLCYAVLFLDIVNVKGHLKDSLNIFFFLFQYFLTQTLQFDQIQGDRSICKIMINYGNFWFVLWK